MKNFLRYFLILTCVSTGILMFMFWMRKPILRLISNQLVREDSIATCDQIVVLSGHAEERGPEAAQLFIKQKGPGILATGGITPRIFREMNINLSEADLTVQVIQRAGVDSDKIKVLRAGTSTWEECDTLGDFATQQKWKSIILVSSLFHTRRMQWVADRTLRKKGIIVYIHGAPPLGFSKDKWWESEEGLLFVVNEYLKLLYYSYTYSD